MGLKTLRAAGKNVEKVCSSSLGKCGLDQTQRRARQDCITILTLTHTPPAGTAPHTCMQATHTLTATPRTSPPCTLNRLWKQRSSQLSASSGENISQNTFLKTLPFLIQAGLGESIRKC